jgi:alanyl-tRNA synthetase/REP element-mobilizing transposase RayT
MSGVFPELRTKERVIHETLRREEEGFNKTLDKGIALFESEIARLTSARSAPGSAGFQPAPAGILPGGHTGSHYWKRRLPHYERPHGIYHVTFSTRNRRVLSPAARMITLNAFVHFDRERYDLFALCVMPDHVHALFQPFPKDRNKEESPAFWSLSELMHSLKSFTANEINKTEGTGAQQVWENEYHDRLMRSDQDVEEKFIYICTNPSRAEVTGPEENYPWIWTWSDRVAGGRQDAGRGEQDARAPQQNSASDFSSISGAFAFRLYDEQGFPFDLTELMARERGLAVDREEFERLMDEQRTRARAAQKKTVIELSDSEGKLVTHFLGYDHDHTGADVLEVTSANGKAAVVLNNSVCYAEMGGQVGDTGEMSNDNHRWKIADTRKAGGTWVHLMEGEGSPQVSEHVTVSFEKPRRQAIERHHTVTHLLHWALHEIVSREAVQKGSYVGPEKLTFDFSSVALTAEQKRDVGKLVNEKIGENAPVSWTEIPYTQAKKRADIQQFFGDKYGDTVRVVQIGGEPERLNGYSMELCGGTHVRATGDIGSFRIVREEAIAAGIRRIEAVAGDAARDWAKQETARQEEKFEALARKKTGIAALPEFAESGETNAMLAQIDARSEHLAKLETEVHEWEKQQAKASEGELRTRAEEMAKELAATNAGEKALVGKLPDADAKLLQAIVDALKPKFPGPIFLAGEKEGRVALIASVPKDLAAQFQANKLIQEIAPIVGGKGGGRPDNAQGAGKDAAKIDDALARARELLL